MHAPWNMYCKVTTLMMELLARGVDFIRSLSISQEWELLLYCYYAFQSRALFFGLSYVAFICGNLYIKRLEVILLVCHVHVICIICALPFSV